MLECCGNSGSKDNGLQTEELSARSGYVRDAIAYIEENYPQRIVLDEMADALYVSKYHLLRSFKAETGKTIHTYITECRMKHACSMIAIGMPMHQVCVLTGYPDYSLFYRNFCKVIGRSPKEFQGGLSIREA